MSDIREKIMAIERPRYCRVNAYKAGFEDALATAADIAEAEVQRLEAINRALRKALAGVYNALEWITEDMELIEDDKKLVQSSFAEAERVLGGE